jgi:Transmembrane secretion effector
LRRKSPVFNASLEGFFDSLAGAVRYMRYAPGAQVILLRSFIFGVLIGAIPALLPVAGLKALHMDAVHLDLVFTSMGLGSLAGAVFVLEPARKRLRPNQMTILGGVALAVVLASMAVVRQRWSFSRSQASSGSLGPSPLPSFGWRENESYQTGSEAG